MCDFLSIHDFGDFFLHIKEWGLPRAHIVLRLKKFL